MAPRNSAFPYSAEVGIPLPNSALSLNHSSHTNEGNGNLHEVTKSISNESLNIQEYGEEEIPIWICGAPRYVSGITNETTCYDVIQVLIEDELRFIHEGQTSHKLSRDVCDYVITEKWRDIEQALPGETLILHIWNEWRVAQNEVKFKLKINKMKTFLSFDTSTNENKTVKSNKGKKANSISRLIRKVIKQGEAIHNQLSNFRLNSSNNFTLPTITRDKVESKAKTLPRRHNESFIRATKANYQTDDEILLILEPDEEDKDSGINIHPGLPRDQFRRSNYLPNFNTAMNNFPNNSIRFSHGKLDKFSKHEFVCSTPHTINRRRKSLQFNIIRNEIVETTQKIDDLLVREKNLAKHLSNERDKYRAQNEIYKRNPGLDVSVEKIQNNLAVYAKEIVQRELDLYRVKTEIQHRCIVLSNLKRMLQGKDAGKYQSFRFTGRTRSYSQIKSSSRFVDNIHEFCDNNESIVV